MAYVTDNKSKKTVGKQPPSRYNMFVEETITHQVFACHKKKYNRGIICYFSFMTVSSLNSFTRECQPYYQLRGLIMSNY